MLTRLATLAAIVIATTSASAQTPSLRPTVLVSGEAGVVVGRHVTQGGDLLTSQSAGPSALSAGQPHVLRLQGLPSSAEEVGQPFSIDHAPILTRAGAPSQGSTDHG